jgi:hypothetical protein
VRSERMRAADSRTRRTDMEYQRRSSHCSCVEHGRCTGKLFETLCEMRLVSKANFQRHLSHRFSTPQQQSRLRNSKI